MSRRKRIQRDMGNRTPRRGPAGHRLAGSHPAGSARHRHRSLVALLICIVVAGGALWVVLAHRSPASDRDTSASPAASSGRSPAASTRLVLQVRPAAYRLPTAISREVVLPSGTFGGQPALMIAGGLTPASTTTAAVRLLNPATGQTRLVGRLAVATHDAAGALLESTPFIFGGGSLSSTDAVQSGQPGRSLAMTAKLPGIRSDLAAVTVAGQAYLVGGYNGASYYSAVLATSDGRRFRVAARLRVPVRYAAVAALGSRIWVFGGQTPSGITSAIQQIDLTTGKATVAGHLPAPVAHASAFTLGGRIFVAGGQTAPAIGLSGTASPSASPRTSKRVLEYVPASVRDNAPGLHPAHGFARIAGHLPAPVANASAAVIGSTAYLVGGDNGHEPLSTVTTFRLVPVSDGGPSGAR